MINDWSQLSPSQFEKLCAVVLRQTGFVNIQWFGEAGADKGRDIIAERVDSPVPGVERRERWMVQCKRYAQKNLGKSELKDLLDAALEHEIDGLLIIVTTSVSANLRDWLESAVKKYPFNAYIWEEMYFRGEMDKHEDELFKALPELGMGKTPLQIYQRRKNTIYLSCDEFAEVEIVVRNTDDVEEAKKMAAQFMRYVMKHGFEWWG
jgi:hypothetical protein